MSVAVSPRVASWRVGMARGRLPREPPRGMGDGDRSVGVLPPGVVWGAMRAAPVGGGAERGVDPGCRPRAARGGRRGGDVRRPLLGHFGGADNGIPLDGVRAMEAALRAPARGDGARVRGRGARLREPQRTARRRRRRRARVGPNDGVPRDAPPPRRLRHGRVGRAPAHTHLCARAHPPCAPARRGARIDGVSAPRTRRASWVSRTWTSGSPR